MVFREDPLQHIVAVSWEAELLRLFGVQPLFDFQHNQTYPRVEIPVGMYYEVNTFSQNWDAFDFDVCGDGSNIIPASSFVDFYFFDIPNGDNRSAADVSKYLLGVGNNGSFDLRSFSGCSGSIPEVWSSVNGYPVLFTYGLPSENIVHITIHRVHGIQAPLLFGNGELVRFLSGPL